MNRNNNNTTTETKLPLEEIIIPDRVADFITKKMDKKKFAEWRDQGIFIQAPHPDGPRDHKGLWLLLQDMGEQERTNCRDMIFDYLKKVEERIHVHNRDQHKCELDVDFYLIVRLLIPSQKCGFVRGKQSETIRKIETDWELDYAKFDKGERIELPPDHGRLIIKGQKVEGMRMAILEVQSLVKKAKGFNPFGLADAHAKDPNEVVKERIFLPLIQVLNERQKKEFRQLQESSGVSNWTVDKGAKSAEGRFIWLEGKASQVVEAKKRIFFFFRQLENDGGSGDTGLSIAEIVIPFPVYREVIGFDGDNIKKLKIDLGVDLRFLGENSEDYPDGRTLRIIGHGEERVRQAREFLEQEYVHNRPKGGNPFWSPPGHNRRSNEPEQQQEEEEEDEVVVEEAKKKQPPPEDLHQREVVIPILVARFATDVTEQCGLFECKSRPMTRRGYGEQTRTLDLYGTKEAVDKAAAMFDVYTAEYEENKQRLLARSAAWKAASEAEEAEAAAERKRQEQEEAAAARQRRIQQQQSKKTEGEGKENKQKILRCFGTRAPKNNDAANAQANDANASSGSNSGGGSSSSSKKKPKQQKVMFDESCTKNAAPAADDDDSFATDDDSDKQFNYSRKNDDGEGQHQQDNTHQALDHMSRMFHRTITLDEEEAEEEEKNDNSKMTEESDEEAEAEKTKARAEEKEREEEREREEEERQKKQEEEEAADLEDATQSLLRGMPIFNVLEQRQEKADTFQREHRELDEKVEREVRSMSRWLVILYREKEALLAQNEALRQEVANLRSQQQGN